MPKKKQQLPLTNPNDSYAFRSAIAWCSKQGLPARRVSPYQLKVGPFNFYPDRGTFNRDDIQPKQTGGFEAFSEAVGIWRRSEKQKYDKKI